MNDEEFKKYVEMLISMSTDYLMGGISRATYENNLRLAVKAMAPEPSTP